jgi:hypothetical protein
MHSLSLPFFLFPKVVAGASMRRQGALMLSSVKSLDPGPALSLDISA